MASTPLTAAQARLQDLWEEHIRCEFATRNTEDTLATMVADAYVNHIPVLTGGVGRDQRPRIREDSGGTLPRCRWVSPRRFYKSSDGFQ